MIRNEAEYQEASKILIEELRRLDEHRSRLEESGLGIPNQPALESPFVGRDRLACLQGMVKIAVITLIGGDIE